MAAKPPRVALLWSNIAQYRTAYALEKKLATNPQFSNVRTSDWGSYRKMTAVQYFSSLDKPKAEALADVLRAEGLPATITELGGDPDGEPGAIQVVFGRDAEKD